MMGRCCHSQLGCVAARALLPLPASQHALPTNPNRTANKSAKPAKHTEHKVELCVQDSPAQGQICHSRMTNQQGQMLRPASNASLYVTQPASHLFGS